MPSMVFDTTSKRNHDKKCKGTCGLLSTTLNPKGKRRCRTYCDNYAAALGEANEMGFGLRVKTYTGQLVTVRRRNR